MRKNTTQVGIAGEHYVLTELARRGAIASMTIGNTKGVDILVKVPSRRNVFFQVEVKTTTNAPSNDSLFPEVGRFYKWGMLKKHETISDSDLIYVFVWLPETLNPPKFFVVKSIDVALYVKKEYKIYMRKKGSTVKDNDMRKFRINEKDPEDYEDNWKILGLK